MDTRQQRKCVLEDHLRNDYELLKRLEDSQRCETDPKSLVKLQADIENLKQQIAAREGELGFSRKVLDPRLQEIVNLYLAASFESDRFAGLDQAGETDPDRTTLLERVFIDLDVSWRRGQQPLGLRIEGLSQLRASSSGPFAVSKEDERLSAMRCLLAEHYPRIAVIGGPGHGKSTLGQYVAQVHRAKRLGRPLEFEPATTRIPFRVVLKYFAQWLADEPSREDLETFLAEQVDRLAVRSVSAEDIQEILRCCPCLLIIDGLDEVVLPELRGRMLARLREFQQRADQLGADLMVMATSRPTGYENEFAPERFWHLELLPLSKDKVRSYAEKWASAKKLSDEEQSRILRTLEECQEDESLSTLLRTPLQVTIILLIIRGGGRPPSQREALFDEYWRTIFRRERSKTRGIIQSDEPLLFKLHAYLGYLLHRRAVEQNVQSLLPEEEFKQAIRKFLRQGDSHSSDEAINSRMEQLVREARNRLVLIVEPQSGLFGFELRSVQEFFAAAHLFLTATGTTERFARLKSIARYEHWRNVALFFAGRVARVQAGEAGNILELACRPVDREGAYRYLRPGAWLSLEIAGDGALSDTRDLQYNALEYGLEVLETGLTTEQQDEIRSIAEQLSPADRRDILRCVLEDRLRSLPIVCLEPVLDVYGQYFGATQLFQEKIDALLRTRRNDAALPTLELALRHKSDPAWMVERLQAHWPHWKERLSGWWARSPEYVENILTTWSPSKVQATELVEAAVTTLWHGYHPIRRHPDEALIWELPMPKSPLDELIVTLRCIGLILRRERAAATEPSIEFGGLGAVDLLTPDEQQDSLNVPNNVTNTLNELLQRSNLTPWLRVLLWKLFWTINRPSLTSASDFLEDIWVIQREQPLPYKFWLHRGLSTWPLLGLAAWQQQTKGRDAVSRLLPFLQADTQLSIAEQVTATIQECVEKPDETLQRRLFTALRARSGLDDLLPELAPLADRMDLTIEDLVSAHIRYFYLGSRSGQPEYTIEELRDLLTAAENSLDDTDKLARLMWVILGTRWAPAPEVLSQARRLLELVLHRLSGPMESPLTRPATLLFVKLLTYDDQIRRIAPRLLAALPQAEDLGNMYVREVVGRLSPEQLSVLESFLTHEDEATRVGAAALWEALIATVMDRWSPLADEDEEIRKVRLAPECGLNFLDDDKRRLTGIALLTLSDYPIGDAVYRQILLNALQQSQSVEEEGAWVRLLREIPITDAKHQQWCSLLEEILDTPQGYSGAVLGAAMERYRSLTSRIGITLTEAEERGLGLP